MIHSTRELYKEQAELFDILLESRVDLATDKVKEFLSLVERESNGYVHFDTMEFQPRVYAQVELKEMCERVQGWQNL